AKTSFRRRASDPGESQLRMASEDSSLSSLLSLALRLPGSSFSEDNPSSASSSRPTLLQGSSFSEENASSPRPTVIASSLSFLLSPPAPAESALLTPSLLLLPGDSASAA
ncbi:unnamed protein product, partial [Polarella glacialis]